MLLISTTTTTGAAVVGIFAIAVAERAFCRLELREIEVQEEDTEGSCTNSEHHRSQCKGSVEARPDKRGWRWRLSHLADVTRAWHDTAILQKIPLSSIILSAMASVVGGQLMTEEAREKYAAIVDMLLAAGYFRARIAALSPFDKALAPPTHSPLLTLSHTLSHHTLCIDTRSRTRFHLFTLFLSVCAGCWWYGLVYHG